MSGDEGRARPSGGGIGRRAASWAGRLALLFAGVTFALLLGELLARAALADVTTVFDTRYWPSVRWFEEHPIARNSWGFRERELAGLPRGDAYRIAVIGDGFTHSQGIADEALLTRVLERRLNERAGGRRFEVFQFALSGAQPDDQLEFLSEYALSIEPDFVLLQWFINDAETERPWRPPRLDVPLLWRFEDAIGVDLRDWLTRRSALYYVASHWLGSVAAERGWIETYEEHMSARLSDPSGSDARNHEAALDRIVELARRNDVPIGIVAFPLLTDVRGDAAAYPLGFLIDRLLEYCRDRELTCVDLRPALAAEGDPRPLWINRLDGHPGPAANELVARELIRAFERQWDPSPESGTTAHRRSFP